MYNCIIVIVNGKKQAIFPDMYKAEMYRQLLQQQFAHLDLTIFCDWAYIEGVAW